jgi:MoaA/NifB/PqqE/SkfB family radical SAM enzyme
MDVSGSGNVFAGDQARRLTIELTNTCNLHCSYCVRDEDALYHTRAEFFSPKLLQKIIRDAKEIMGISYVSFTGGEVTIHPQFDKIVETVVDAGIRFGFVTNGWHFDRVYPLLLKNLPAVRTVAFSLDGTTKELHDRWRGEGSFVRVIRAITRCNFSGLPFMIKVAVRRDTLPHLQEFSLMSAKLGAKRIDFSHLLPTSSLLHDEMSLTQDERREAEHEIAILSNILKMKVGIAVGYHNVDPGAPCTALRGDEPNIDYRGRLTLCCNLSGYRGAVGEPDVFADLNKDDFRTGYLRLKTAADLQVKRRKDALEALERSGQKPDTNISSPCMFCLQSFDKIPWQSANKGKGRMLPVFTSN